MTTLLILFFISLVGIIFMIGKKMIFLKNNQVIIEEGYTFGAPHVDEIKYVTVKKLKEYGYILVVTTIRFSMKSSKFIKNTSEVVYRKIKDKLLKSKNGIEEEVSDKKEVSKFLKMVSEYKHKLNRIKHKIKEEEGI